MLADKENFNILKNINNMINSKKLIIKNPLIYDDINNLLKLIEQPQLNFYSKDLVEINSTNKCFYCNSISKYKFNKCLQVLLRDAIIEYREGVINNINWNNTEYKISIIDRFIFK